MFLSQLLRRTRIRALHWHAKKKKKKEKPSTNDATLQNKKVVQVLVKQFRPRRSLAEHEQSRIEKVGLCTLKSRAMALQVLKYKRRNKIGEITSLSFGEEWREGIKKNQNKKSRNKLLVLVHQIGEYLSHDAGNPALGHHLAVLLPVAAVFLPTPPFVPSHPVDDHHQEERGVEVRKGVLQR